MKDNYRYVAVLEYGNEEIGVYFPDLDGCITGGEDVDDALKNASDVLKLHIYGMEQDKEKIPEPTSITNLELSKNEIPVLVDIYMKPFREKMDEKFIKKTLSIPNWMNTLAEENGINFSKTLQNALIKELNIQEF